MSTTSIANLITVDVTYYKVRVSILLSKQATKYVKCQQALFIAYGHHFVKSVADSQVHSQVIALIPLTFIPLKLFNLNFHPLEVVSR